LTTVEAPFVELPAIPEAVDIEQFHLDVKQLTLDVNSEPVDVLKNTTLVTEMLQLVETTSGNELERKLALHVGKVKQKLKAVLKFKSVGKSMSFASSNI
jgi:hypothetical protein